MRNLITGGAGFVGSHLAEKLIERDQNVTVLDNFSTGELENIKHLKKNKQFKLEVGSVLDKEVIDDLVDEADRVYHLAAAVGVEYVLNNPLKTMEINLEGTKNILGACNKDKTSMFLASTSEIYGKNENVPFSEKDDRLLGSTHITRWSYSSTKAMDEFFARAFYRKKQVPVVIGRLFNTVGPKQTGQYGMVIPTFVNQALLGHPISVYGDGEQTRTFLDVDDATDAILKLMNTEECHGEAFNIGSQEEISIKKLAGEIKNLVNSESNIKFVPYDEAYEKGFEDMRHRIPDVSKIKEYVDYEQTHNLEDTLGRIINFFRSNKDFS